MHFVDFNNLVYKLLYIYVEIRWRKIEKKVEKIIKRSKIKTIRLIENFKKIALVNKTKELFEDESKNDKWQKNLMIT